MIEMAQVESSRYLLHVEGKSQRDVAKILGISRQTVAKYKDKTEPPEYKKAEPRQTSVFKPEYKLEMERMLEENKTLPRKLRKEKRRHEAFVPLVYEPGQVAVCAAYGAGRLGWLIPFVVVRSEPAGF